MVNSDITLGSVHKLRNADGVGGQSAKVLLLTIAKYGMSLIKRQPNVTMGGWVVKKSEKCIT